jgi:hypothetical protein
MDYLTTSYLDGILPGLVQKYGEDRPMKIAFRTKVSPQSFFNPGQVGAKLSAYLDFMVDNDVAVGLSVNDAFALVTPTLDNFILKLKISQIKFDAIEVTSSQIGPDVKGNELKVFLNTLFRMLIPFINNLVLAPGFTIPDTFFGVMRIKSAVFAAKDGFVNIGFVPEFI